MKPAITHSYFNIQRIVEFEQEWVLPKKRTHEKTQRHIQNPISKRENFAKIVNGSQPFR